LPICRAFLPSRVLIHRVAARVTGSAPLRLAHESPIDDAVSDRALPWLALLSFRVWSRAHSETVRNFRGRCIRLELRGAVQTQDEVTFRYSQLRIPPALTVPPADAASVF
jgi:hypothetical protein